MDDEVSLRWINNLRQADEVDGDVHRRAYGRLPSWGSRSARVGVCGAGNQPFCIVRSYKKLYYTLCAARNRAECRRSRYFICL